MSTYTRNDNPVATMFSIVGGFVGLGYGGYMASVAGAEGGGTLLSGVLGLFLGAVVGRAVGNTAFRLILIGLAVLEAVATRMIWGGFWNGIFGA